MPFACGVGLCSSNCSTHKGPFRTTHKTKTKRIIKIKNPKKSIEKAKRRGKKTSRTK
jgi:hypothetical protein